MFTVMAYPVICELLIEEIIPLAALYSVIEVLIETLFTYMADPFCAALIMADV